MKNELSDNEILARVAKGEDDLFSLLIDRHANRLYAWAWRYTASTSEAEELLQETLLKTYRSAKSYDPRRPCLPWMFTILANLCHDWHKKKLPQLSLDRESENGTKLLDSLSQPSAGPEESSIRDETIREVRAALDSLDEQHRSVFLLYYFEDFSQAEIAKTLNIPLGTVKSRLFNGGKKLANILSRRLGQ